MGMYHITSVKPSETDEEVGASEVVQRVPQRSVKRRRRGADRRR